MRTFSVLLTLLATMAAADTPPAPPAKDATIGVLGRLTVAKDRPGVVSVHAGPTRYDIPLDEAAFKKAARLKRKFVVLGAKIVERAEKNTVVTLALIDGRPIVAQEMQAVKGFVRTLSGRKSAYLLESEGGACLVEGSDARAFKKHVDAYVAARGYLTADGTFRKLEAVRKVERAVPPGARAPKKGPEALTGKWKGTMIAEKINPNAPGRPGDSFPVLFTAGKDLEKVDGKLFATYAIVGARVRKFVAKRRTIEFELYYTFSGGGRFTVRCKGTMSEDFKKVEGTWQSGFLGSGPMTLEWAPLGR